MAPPVLPDYLESGLRAIFVGTAAGERSAAVGGYYAGPGNQFWEFLFRSGLTPERLGPDRSAEVLRFGLGLTDIAKARAASRDTLLARSDFDVPGFIAKVARDQPAWVAFHGKTAAKVVSRFVGAGREISLGRQSWTIGTSRVFVLPSASGSNQDPARLEGKASRLEWFRDLRWQLARP